ncbi:hypothetical protein [Algiphilus sp.]|uniref:PA3496 family putative envelope integrity protein n=1 Tax=Algiphilus sp. TaxID=1872431 RepID=UPI001CA714E2|nr:hypothetical protein [Algiphilus sp.]MBY8965986.1 hypothetical protein [Algiphilus acroporae]MCI5063330.1 hypothetical protein [Algiphilus sp.]MCI5105060.1 hypothetical protein [Algiphilus sp.]MCR9091645.1 hypothetical protein [Pseudomonadota bacterium]
MAAKKKDPDTDLDDDFDEVDESPVDENETHHRSVAPPGVRLRDWRDIERYREERALRKMLDEDDLLFDDD